MEISFDDSNNWKKAPQIRTEKRVKAESMITSKVDHNNYYLAKLENDVGDLREFTAKWTSWVKVAVRNGEISAVLTYIDDVNEKVERACRSLHANATIFSSNLTTPSSASPTATNIEGTLSNVMETTNQMRKRRKSRPTNPIPNSNPPVASTKNSIKKRIVEKNSPIIEPRCHDVLSGKGYTIIFTKGNQYFRKLVNILRHEYVVTPKEDKTHFAEQLHEHIRSLDPPGRFLKQTKDKKSYVEISIKESLQKTSQALREKQPEIRKKIESGEVKVKAVKKSEVAYLITQRSAQVYNKVFPEYAATKRGSEPFLPSFPASDAEQGPAAHKSSSKSSPEINDPFRQGTDSNSDEKGSEIFLPYSPTPDVGQGSMYSKPPDHKSSKKPSPEINDPFRQGTDSDSDIEGSEAFLPSFHDDEGLIGFKPVHMAPASSNDLSKNRTLRKGIYIDKRERAPPSQVFIGNDDNMDHLGTNLDEKKCNDRDASTSSLSRSFGSCSINTHDALKMSVGSLSIELSSSSENLHHNDTRKQPQMRKRQSMRNSILRMSILSNFSALSGIDIKEIEESMGDCDDYDNMEETKVCV